MLYRRYATYADACYVSQEQLAALSRAPLVTNVRWKVSFVCGAITLAASASPSTCIMYVCAFVRVCACVCAFACVRVFAYSLAVLCDTVRRELARRIRLALKSRSLDLLQKQPVVCGDGRVA